MIRFFLPLVLLACAVLDAAQAANPKDPVEVTGDPGTFIMVPCSCSTGVTQCLWTVIDDGLSLFPQSQQKDPTVAVVIAPKAGTYRLLCTCVCANNQLCQTTYEIIVFQETKKRKVYGPLASGQEREKPAVAEATPSVTNPQPVTVQPAGYYSMPLFMGGCSGGGCSGGFCR